MSPPPSTNSPASHPTKFANYPPPHEHKHSYVPPPKASNPVFRGLPLAIGASIITALPPLQTLLFNNAGFNKLRDLHFLKDVPHRYDPTVIPLVDEKDRSTDEQYTDPALLRDVPRSRATNPSSGPNGDDGAAGSGDTAAQADSSPPHADQGFYSIRDFHAAYRSGRVTPRQVVDALLPLIRRDAQPASAHSVAFLATNVDAVVAAADASTARWAAGKALGVLDGVPVAVKDEVDLKDYDKRFGSARSFRMEENETSWCVARWEEEGAVVVGKTNMHEVGMDTTNNNPVTGTPRNPYNAMYYTGGSSGGSGYAVGAGLVPIALGCDGGGSIRIPSTYCGIYGLKTTQSRVSARPSPALASTNAVCGPMCADMTSLEVAWRVMGKPDPLGGNSAVFPAPRRTPLTHKVIGVFPPWFDSADAPVRDACRACIQWLQDERGFQVVDISLPLLNEGQTAHALTIMNEVCNAFAHAARDLQPANRVLFAVASRATAQDFLHAASLRYVLMQHLAWLWHTHPGLLVVSPTTPNVGWPIGGRGADLARGVSNGDMTLRNMMYIWLANFAGAPALSAPVGYADPVQGEGRIPMGIMAMGAWGAEDELVEFGFEVEKWLVEGPGRRRPKAWVDLLGLARGEGKGVDERSGN